MILALEPLDSSVEMAGGVWLSLYCKGMKRRCRGILRFCGR